MAAAFTVSVRLFAALRERVGAKCVQIEFADPVPVSDVLDRLAELHPAARPFRSVMKAAIEDSYVSDDAVVKGPGELAVITPVSGG